MKRLFLCIFAFLMVASDWAQQNSLSITVVQPKYENVPEEARLSLESKLDQILSNNSVVSGMSDRFVISAKVNVIQRDIMPSNPPKVSEKMDLTIIIGDAIDNRVFSKTTITVSGIGVTDTKALIQAFQRISPNNEKIKQMVEQARTQINDYYANHCDDILIEVDRMAKMNQCDEAISKLLAVPELCSDCYNQAQMKALDLYQSKIDNESQLLLKQAKAEWAIHHDYEHAKNAMAYLLQINPHSSIVNQADDLFHEIEQTLRKQEQAIAAHQKEIEQREWDLRVQQYKDNVELRKLRIDMFKEVGVAIGKGLPDSVTKIVRMW